MIEINEKNHASVVISSLEKIYNNGKITGKLEATDLYILNLIYRLLSGCCLELTDYQKKYLMNAYRNIYFHSTGICPINAIEIYKPTYRTPFFQADAIDCNDYPVADKIYYWQEESYLTEIDDILPLVDDQDYFLDKLFDTKEVFAVGKEIDYENIGRVCFAITEATSTDDYEIYDAMNNNVTSTFDNAFVDAINTMIFVSQNIYSHGLMKFKIKKI
jgi:hypothetical protein